MESLSTRARVSAFLILFVFALCLGLGAGLLYRHSAATQERQQYLATINQLSNAWHDACFKLDEQKLVNLSLERDLSTAIENAISYSNRLNTVSAESVKTSPARDAASPKSGQPDPKVAELQDERDGLTAKLDGLASAMAKLDCDLAETQRKLEASEGDREALLQELKRIEADRTRLMRQFNDLALVRAQLRKLKAEQVVSRRLEWIRRDMFGSYKGGELLRKGLVSAAPASQNYDLNVEVRRNEGARAVPPEH